ncbi:MAG: 3-dehydroquinate synthase [Planctomycetota bacterium]|nr:3-dehydroquinate synthase [Planctomycetota bacterium]
MLVIPMPSHDSKSEFNGLASSDRCDDAKVKVSWMHRVRMTRNAFDPTNTTLIDSFGITEHGPHRAIVVVDEGVAKAWPDLIECIRGYSQTYTDRLQLIDEPIVIPGGETCKNDWNAFHQVIRAIEKAKICRHSYVIAIGGGAILDVVGFAAATAHRGVRLIRIPTTTLAQGDSGIGVKNGLNDLGKKNFLGTFSPPWAVINDDSFLSTLSDRDWRSGFSEAIKVALVKDAHFFEDIERLSDRLGDRDERAAQPLIRKSAQLHLQHIITSGDAFELTSARPLDFGHWAAHKLEAMTDYRLTHGEAVAIGMAIDVTYSSLIGLLDEEDEGRILNCLKMIGFTLSDEAMGEIDTLLEGLEEFREHLGGQLTIPLLGGIGKQIDVHEIDLKVMKQAIERLSNAQSSSTAT